MSQTLCVTPAGRLVNEPAPDSPFTLDNAVAAGLEASFAESPAQGLLWLASNRLKAPLPPAIIYWRDFSERLFHEICHLGEGVDTAKWSHLSPPADAQMQAIIAAAPPARGLEYLTEELLGRLWCDLRQLVVDEAKRHGGGPKEYLRSVNPVWHLLGKVTFHLAENKRDEERPFAFLATYTKRVSAGRLQHVPLGQALKDYAGEKNQARLATLLEPVRAAADLSPCVRELLDSRGLFQPQPWSIREAYRFLTESPRMEAAGVVVRVPDWWTPRQPPRPQVRVRLGQKPASQLGLDGLLDFSAELALDGEPLSEGERRQLLNSSDGLLLLRGRWVEVNRRQIEEALDHWRQLESLHPDGISFVQGMRLLAGVPLDGEAPNEAIADWSQLIAGDWLRGALTAMRQPGGIDALQPGAELQATLRSYQADGVRWLWLMTRLGLGACLADDMGLGKTIQVIDLLLQIMRGCVTAIVSGSEIYEIKIDVSPVNKASWKKIKQDCSRSIDSLIDLLQGRFAKGVMERLTRQEGGLFPKPKEISVRCSCPDWAVLCKHDAAALYGIGARLDSAPEMLFLLRGVDHLDLISQAVDGANLDAALASGKSGPLAGEDLGELFGIDMEAPDDESQAKRPAASRARRSQTARSKPNTTKARDHAARTRRSGRQREETASVGVKRAVKKKAVSQTTAAAKSARRTENGKPKPLKK